MDFLKEPDRDLMPAGSSENHPSFGKKARQVTNSRSSNPPGTASANTPASQHKARCHLVQSVISDSGFILSPLNEEDILMRKHQQGFTLIELMIVVAIIGILAAIAIPQYQDFTARSQMAEALSLGGGLKTTVVEIANQGAMADADSGSNGIPAATGVKGKYVSQVAVADGLITATIVNAAPAANVIRGKTLSLSPIQNEGSVTWVCKSSDTAQKYLPKACTGT